MTNNDLLIELHEKRDYFRICHHQKLEQYAFDNSLDLKQLEQLITDLIELKASIHLCTSRIQDISMSLQTALFTTSEDTACAHAAAPHECAARGRAACTAQEV